MPLMAINLVMFDTQVTTQDSLSVEMKTFYEDTLIDTAEPKLVHDQFGDKASPADYIEAVLVTPAEEVAVKQEATSPEESEA